MSKKAIARTTAVMILMIIVLAAAVATVVVYYVAFPPSSPPSGPATIAGRITDNSTGAPIAGATVKLDGLSYTTGSDGNYSFTVNVGNYTLTASSSGYVANTASVSVTAATTYSTNFALALGHKFKMALMVGGDETDLGFSYMAITGANDIATKYGWDVSISRLVAFADQDRIASDYASRGYDLVCAVGGQFFTTMYFDVPGQYNNTFFAQIPGGLNVTVPPNVVALHPAFQTVGNYLAGVLAGKMTKTNAVAWVTGQWFDYLSMEFNAFKAGVQSVNNATKVIGTAVGTWGDASQGYQVAQSIINTYSTDIIVQVADLTGRGVIAACQARNVTVIGTVADQDAIAPSITLTSIIMDTPKFMDMIAQNITAGTFKQEMAGKLIDIDLSYLAPFHQFDSSVPQSVKDLLATTESNIQNGIIVVPRNATAPTT